MLTAGAGPAALTAVTLEVERHVGARGWDAPPRLFALVPTAALLAAEPGLGGPDRPAGADGDPDALSAVEQDDFTAADAALVPALESVWWPPAVVGCAVSVERTVLPQSAEADLERLAGRPDAEVAAAVAAHPERLDVRLVVAVDRSGNSSGVARLRSHPDELIAAPDLVPELVRALAHTLAGDGSD